MKTSMMSELQFRKFYESTQKKLWAYVFRTCGDSSLTDDIVQDAYIRFLHSERHELSEPQMKAYVFRIATNRLYDHWRQKRGVSAWSQEASELAEQVNVEEALHLRHDISKAFGELPPQQRSLLWLAYVEEYAHRDIADMLNLREKSVRVLLFRAKQKLIGILERFGITSEEHS